MSTLLLISIYKQKHPFCIMFIRISGWGFAKINSILGIPRGWNWTILWKKWYILSIIVSKIVIHSFFYKNQLFLAESQLFLFLNSFYFWPAFSYDPPWIICLKCFLWSLRFPDQLASSMNIFQNTNFTIWNLRLAVLIKVVLLKMHGGAAGAAWFTDGNFYC